MSSGTTTAPTKRKRGWSQSEDDTLRQLWPNNPDTTVMAALGRSQSNVHGRAKKLGIKRSPEYLELAKERAAQRIKTDPPPIGVRLNLLTTHGAHTQGVLSPVNFKYFAGWEHMARASEHGMIT